MNQFEEMGEIRKQLAITGLALIKACNILALHTPSGQIRIDFANKWREKLLEDAKMELDL